MAYRCNICGAASNDAQFYKSVTSRMRGQMKTVEHICAQSLDRAADEGALVVFGDNLEGWGRGGQAKHARGHPAAVGIPTKRNPRVYLRDEDFDEWREAVRPRVEALAAHLRAGGDVWWPRDRIGTGRANLETKAPRIANACTRLRTWLTLVSLGEVE